jgi:uracil-DNA glycosylase
MDRREAILRELNVYPLWKRRGQPAPIEAVVPNATSRLGGGEADTQQSAMGIVEPVLSEVEGLNPSYVSSPSDGGQEIANLDWPQLKEVVHDCTACRLRAGCTQTVFGVGDGKADWLFVGEGPGADEDALGEPFVGQAGKLLDSMLAAIKLKRGKNVYIANIVKCRPPDNRNPAADEIAQCLPYLERQIALIQPRLIVALGKTAATALLGKDATIGSLRGTLHDYHGIPLIVTYHPAYLLRSPTEKAKAWQDLCFATDTMQKL